MIILVNNDAVCAPDFVAQPARAVRRRVGRHGGGRAPAGSRTGADRLGRHRARHDPRLVGLPLEPAGERTRRRARPGRPVRRRSRVSPARIPGARRLRRDALRVLGGRRSRAALPRRRLALRARVRTRARCTSTGRHSAPRHPRRADWRPSAGATCSRSTASAAATRCEGRRSQRSTGPCSPFTSSSGGRRDPRASAFGPARSASGLRVAGHHWSSPQSAS